MFPLLLAATEGFDPSSPEADDVHDEVGTDPTPDQGFDPTEPSPAEKPDLMENESIASYRDEPASRIAAPPAEPGRTGGSALQRLVLAGLLIAAAALIGYVLSNPSADAPDPDVFARSVGAADQLEIVLDTADPLEARRFVRAEFGWRVGVPVFGQSGPQMRGVAVAQVAPAVEVPVFLYAREPGLQVAVFAYSYALLDQVPDRLRLARADYDDLAAGTPTVRRAGGSFLLLWRDRDDIYVAVTDLAPSLLAETLTMVR